MRAWHFATSEGHLRGSTPWAIGQIERHDGPLVLCDSGLHASVDPLSAMKYAKGTWIRRVECGGKIVRGADKLVCSERTPIWAYDATDVLRKFARLCALDVVDLWRAPEIVVRYLRTGDEMIRLAAWFAGRDAAMDGTGAAAWDAAWSGTWAAATGDVAWNATGSVAGAVAKSAALATAWDTGEETVLDAAWSTAWDATRRHQSKRLTRMLAEGRPR